jgi:hypothetical protein
LSILFIKCSSFSALVKIFGCDILVFFTKFEENVTKSCNAVKINTSEVKPSTESASLFPQRKQIFDSSNITDTVVPIAPPRIKGQKRNNLKKQAPSPTAEDAEKINFVKNQKLLSFLEIFF